MQTAIIHKLGYRFAQRQLCRFMTSTKAFRPPKNPVRRLVGGSVLAGSLAFASTTAVASVSIVACDAGAPTEEELQREWDEFYAKSVKPGEDDDDEDDEDEDEEEDEEDAEEVQEEDVVDSSADGGVAVFTSDQTQLANMEGSSEDIFHLVKADLWRSCSQQGEPYKPPTYDQDGGFIHATREPATLLGVANHFYKSDPSDYLLLRISVEKLEEATVKYEPAAPVGNTEAHKADGALFPHIYGPLNPSSVIKEYKVERNPDGSFVSIPGLIN